MSLELVKAIWTGKTEKALSLLDTKHVQDNINNCFPSKDEHKYPASTCLYKACGKNNFKVVEKMLSLPGIDIHAGTTTNYTALHDACWNGHVGLIQLLLMSGAQITAAAGGNTPLHLACRNGQAKALISLLDNDRTAMNHKNVEGRTPLHMASINGSVACVDVLVFRFNADPLARDISEETALDIAVRKGHKEVAKLLREVHESKLTGIDIGAASKESKQDQYLTESGETQSQAVRIEDPYLQPPDDRPIKAVRTEDTYLQLLEDRPIQPVRIEDPYLHLPEDRPIQNMQELMQQMLENQVEQNREIQAMRTEIQTLKSDMSNVMAMLEKLAADVRKGGPTGRKPGSKGIYENDQDNENKQTQL